MSDIAISGMTALGGAPATNDLLVVVDVSDHTQAPTGTTKNMTVANLFTAPALSAPHMTAPVIDSGGLAVAAGGIVVTLGGLSVTGTSAITGTLGVTSDFAIATNKFTVTASSGNTSIAGTLGVTSDFAVATSKFTVTASSGNTAIAGTLTVTGSTSTGITAGSSSEGQTITAVKSVSVGSVSPATLLSLVGLRGGQAFVYGDDGSGHTFIDIIWFGAAGTAVGPASQPLNSTAGTASRAYGISSTNLTLQMTSGTYTVKFAPTLITTT